MRLPVPQVGSAHLTDGGPAPRVPYGGRQTLGSTAEARFELGDVQNAAQLFRDSLEGDLKPKWLEVWAHINLGKIYDIRGGQRERATSEYQKAINTGDDSYGAQAAAREFLQTPFRQAPSN